MIHLFVQIAVCVAATIGAILIGNEIVETSTGKSIRKHLIEWWNEVYADIQRWLAAHPDLKVARVVASAACIIDQSILSANQLLRIVFQAEPLQGEPHVISERTFTAQEAVELFPHLMHATRVILPLEN